MQVGAATWNGDYFLNSFTLGIQPDKKCDTAKGVYVI